MTNKETLKELIDQLLEADYPNVERFLKSLVNLDTKRTLHELSGNLILYGADLEAWAQQQARALRAMDWAALDVEHLAEKVESLGNEQEHAVTSHLRILLLHLLKWRYQPDKRSESWTSSIGNARDEIEDRLVRNPGICPRLDGFLATVYPRARRTGTA